VSAQVFAYLDREERNPINPREFPAPFTREIEFAHVDFLTMPPRPRSDDISFKTRKEKYSHSSIERRRQNHSVNCCRDFTKRLPRHSHRRRRHSKRDHPSLREQIAMVTRKTSCFRHRLEQHLLRLDPRPKERVIAAAQAALAMISS